MGSRVRTGAGPVTFALDLAGGPEWTGRDLLVQVLRPGGGMPTIAHTEPFRPGSEYDDALRFTVGLSDYDGTWVVLRVTEPGAPPDGRATGIGAVSAALSPTPARSGSTRPEPPGDEPQPERETEIKNGSTALSIKSERADRLARELSALTGESITATVELALAERLEAERRRRRRRSLDDIVERFRALPILGDPSAEEILGYGDDGLPR